MSADLRNHALLTPINRATLEFYAHAKAISRSWQTINHSSDLPKFSRQTANKRRFSRLPEPLADYARTVGTDIFRKCSLPRAGFF